MIPNHSSFTPSLLQEISDSIILTHKQNGITLHPKLNDDLCIIKFCYMSPINPAQLKNDFLISFIRNARLADILVYDESVNDFFSNVETMLGFNKALTLHSQHLRNIHDSIIQSHIAVESNVKPTLQSKLDDILFLISHLDSSNSWVMVNNNLLVSLIKNLHDSEVLEFENIVSDLIYTIKYELELLPEETFN